MRRLIDDRFGAALNMADVTGDRVVDLIVGAPGEDAGAGQVVVLPGSTTGLVVASPTVLAQGASGARHRRARGRLRQFSVGR